MQNATVQPMERRDPDDRIASGRPSDTVTLRLGDVVKSFSGVVALKGVTFESLAGEVHALVGENGAGKSTLMGVAAGDLVPDSGTVEIDGVPVGTFSSANSAALGLALVHQHPALLPDMTVAENLILAMPPAIRAGIRDRTGWVRERLAQWGADIPPNARAGSLTRSEQHLVETIKATALNPRVLILDEPPSTWIAMESSGCSARSARWRPAATPLSTSRTVSTR